MSGPPRRHGAAVDALVERAAATIPFYRKHLAGRAGAPLAELPTCAKSDLVGWGPLPLGDQSSVPLFRMAATSGTTGPRLLVGYSRRDWERIAARLAERAAEMSFGAGDLLCNTHGHGLWIGGPTLDLLAEVSGAALLPAGPGRVEQLVRWLAELPVTALSATPSFMRYLAERVERDGLDTTAWSLRLGFIGGEGATTALRRRTVAALDGAFHWHELYGATEVGGPVLGWSPPDDPFGGLLRLDTTEFVVELLHIDRDEPVATGEVGEITVTTPYREASPLIRYRTRDLARSVADDAGGCAIVTTLLGRVDDALKVRGALVHPGAVEHYVVSHCPPGVEWRIVLDRPADELDVLTVLVEHDELGAAGLAERLADGLGVRAVVEVVAPGTLERFQGKAARVVDRRNV